MLSVPTLCPAYTKLVGLCLTMKPFVEKLLCFASRNDAFSIPMNINPKSQVSQDFKFQMTHNAITHHLRCRELPVEGFGRVNFIENYLSKSNSTSSKSY